MQLTDSLDSQRLLARLALLGAMLVLMVVVTSAYLRLSQAGLGCADWPACYGRLAANSELGDSKANRAPEPQAISWARSAHRLTASMVGGVVLLLAILAWLQRPAAWRNRLLAIALLSLTLFLAVLGNWTPAARIPAIAMGNLLCGLAMLALLWWLYLLNAPNPDPELPKPHGLDYWARLGLLLLGVQIILGGLVSANFAALSCTTLPDCHGAWWPAGFSLADLDPFRELALDSQGKIAVPASTASVHMLHRFAALAIVAYLAWLGIKVLALGNDYRRLGVLLLGLVSLQVTLGISAVGFGLPLALVVAHNGVAAGLLLTLLSVKHRLSSQPANGLLKL